MKKLIIGPMGHKIINLEKYSLKKANKIVKFYENHETFKISTLGE